jgi:hypothetical protein
MESLGQLHARVNGLARDVVERWIDIQTNATNDQLDRIAVAYRDYILGGASDARILAKRIRGELPQVPPKLNEFWHQINEIIGEKFTPPQLALLQQDEGSELTFLMAMPPNIAIQNCLTDIHCSNRL